MSSSRIPGFQRMRRVHVADRDVAVLPQRVIRQTMLLHVAPHVAIGPVDDRMEFPAAFAQFEHARFGARARSACGASRRSRCTRRARATRGASVRPCAGGCSVRGRRCPAPRAGRGALPSRRYRARAGYTLRFSREALDELVGEAIRFRKQITGVDQDHRHVRAAARDEMQHRSGLRAEARRQHVRAGQRVERPVEPLLGRAMLEPLIDFDARALVFAAAIRSGRFT